MTIILYAGQQAGTRAYKFNTTTRISFSKRYNVAEMEMPGTTNTKAEEQKVSLLISLLASSRDLDVDFLVTKRSSGNDYTNGTGTDGHPDYTDIMKEIEWLEDYVFLGTNKNYLLDVNGRTYRGTVDDFNYTLTGESSHSMIQCRFTLRIGNQITTTEVEES
jgi:hypothetical protein